MKRIFTITTAIIAVILCSGSYQDDKYEAMRLKAQTTTTYYPPRQEPQKRLEKPRLDKINFDKFKKTKLKSEQEKAEQKALDDFLNKKKKH